MSAEQIALVRELHGVKCQCGAAKAADQTFCRRCYFLLPRPMRTALYLRLGQGYEAAYAAAIAVLNPAGGLM